MDRTTFSIILFWGLLATAFGQRCPLPNVNDFNGRLLVDNFEAFWRVDGNDINIVMCAQTDGYVGFGVTRSGRMPDSDVVVGWIDNNDQPQLQDGYVGNSRRRPTRDTDPGVRLMGGGKSNGWIYVAYRRALRLQGRNHQDFNIGRNTVIYAFRDGAITSYDQVGYHGGNRGHPTIDIRAAAPTRPPPPTRGPVPPPGPTRPPQPGRCPIPPTGDGYREMRMDNNYVLYWRSLPGGRSIMFVACVRTDGWVGLGISPGGSMLDSDVVIGWIRPDNSPGFQDGFVQRVRQRPSREQQSGWNLMDGRRDGSWTRLSYMRTLRAPPGINHKNIEIGPNRIIWAYRNGQVRSYDEVFRHDTDGRAIIVVQEVRPPPPTRGPVPPPRPTRPPQPGRCPIPPMGDGYQEMRMDNNYVLYWRSLPDGRSIMFVACVRTDGWVGLGISPGGSMLDSDVVIGWIRPDNSPGFQDGFVGRVRERPSREQQSGWDLMDGRRDGSWTRLSYMRTLRAPPGINHKNIEIGPNRIIWAYRNGQVRSYDDVSKHDTDGRATIVVQPVTEPRMRDRCPIPPRGTYSSSTLEQNNYMLYWRMLPGNQELEVVVCVRTNGWIGFGFSPDGRMTDSDVVLGWIRQNGRPAYQDAYVGDQRVRPTPETVIGWRLVGGMRQDGWSRISYTRPLMSPGGRKHMDIRMGPNRVIWAYRAGQIEQYGETQPHSDRGSSSINIQGVRPPPPTRGPVPPPRPTRSPQPGRCPIPPMGDGYREMRMDNNYVLYWRSLPDGRSIMFVACVRTDGWVGLGISPGGSMLDSDVVIGWIRPDNSPGFQDGFVGRVRERPSREQQSGWDLMDGRRDGSWTRLSYMRTLRAPPGINHKNIEIGPNRIIWAYRNGQVRSYDDVSKHDTDGRATIVVQPVTEPRMRDRCPIPPRGTYSSSTLEQNNYMLYWRMLPGNQELEVVVCVRTNGWIGFGFSPDGRMTDSDVVLGWIRQNGRPAYQDAYVGDQRVRPTPETVIGWRLVGGMRQDGWSRISYTRPLMSPGGRKHMDIRMGPNRVIWAYRAGQIEQYGETQPHSDRGSSSINIQGVRPPPPTRGPVPPPRPTRSPQPGRCPIPPMGDGYREMRMDNNYVLYWRSLPDGRSIMFVACVRTDGWVGLGISPGGSMLDSDVVIGWIRPDNSPGFQDGFVGRVRERPSREQQSGWDLMDGRRDGSWTRLSYMRTLRAPPGINHKNIEIGPNRIIWAYRNGQVRSYDDVSKHDTDGRATIVVQPVMEPRMRDRCPIPPRGTYSSSTLEQNNYMLYWRMSPGNQELEVVVCVRTTGWIGFGFSPDGRMTDSDVVLGWIRQNGRPAYQDAYVGDQRVRPTPETVIGWRLVGGMRQDGWSRISYTRPLMSPGGRKHMDIRMGPNRVIWAYRAGQIEQYGETQPHSDRGSSSINIQMSGDPCPGPPAGNSYTTMVLSENDYVVYWRNLPAVSYVEIVVCARTDGWVGFGLTESGGMTNSDVVVGWVHPNGTALHQDGYVGRDRVRPAPEMVTGWRLIEGRRLEGWTRITYMRTLAAPGGRNHKAFVIGDNNIIWAFRQGQVRTYDEVVGHVRSARGANTLRLEEPMLSNRRVVLTGSLTAVVLFIVGGGVIIFFIWRRN